MKKNCFFLFVLLCSSGFSFGQKTKELLSVRIGYSSTNILFKEAVEPSFQFFGVTFKSGKTFVGEGAEFGISKSIHSKLFMDVSISSFKGQDFKTRVNNAENYYTLIGFQIPVTANYLFRDSSKRFRVNLGAGFQYLRAHLQQFEKITANGMQTVTQLTDINISEFQFALRPGIQLRILPNLFATFIVKVSLSSNGRYSDNPCLSLKYTFNNKK
ncbi:MAG: outer membrane beta-barrel protein [Chitinophagaceae bacterium]|jgi:hypothetical protein|nr:outer membrane beta-barrel protein [Chitinophagaceae bacterium]